jgi:outer membrane protein OmpU
MKYVLFASTALATVAAAGMASAQGMTLFGDARGGLYYDELLDNELQTTYRFRFGVRAEVETDSGITVGAEARADNANEAEQGTEGNFFVSGSLGTVTFGDTDGADERWVGDVPGNLSLTGLGDQNETVFLTNGGDFGDGAFGEVADDEFARPTIRYDFTVAGFGVSLSSNRTLQDWAVGGGYDFETGMGGVNIGVGYAEIDGFELVSEQGVPVTLEDINGDPVTAVGLNGDPVVLVTPIGVVLTQDDITSYSASIGGTFENFEAGVTWINNESDSADFQILNVGAETAFGEFGVGAYYTTVLDSGGVLAGDEAVGEINIDGDDGFGVTADYELGGGARVAGGVAKRRDRDSDEYVADLGIKVDF